MIPPLTPEERARALAAIPQKLAHARPRLSPGRIAYLFWHEPRQWLRPKSDRWGQFWIRCRMWRAERQLRFSALPPRAGPPVEIAMITGRRYVTQTLFAMKSWLRYVSRPVHFTLIDDGSLGARAQARLRRAGPVVSIKTMEEVERQLDVRFPVARFPVLRRLRRSFIFARKLTDTMLDEPRRRIITDTDLLLHRSPDELLALYDEGRGFYFQDCAQSYGMSVAELSHLSGIEVPPKVNAGCYCLDGSRIDWDFVETLSGRILATHGLSFYHEQALVAVLNAVIGGVQLSSEYLVLPDEAECRRPTRTALHYLSGANNPLMLLSWPLLFD